MSDEHTDRDHKGDFPGLIYRYQFSDVSSERLGDLDQCPPLPKNETGEGSCHRTGKAERMETKDAQGNPVNVLVTGSLIVSAATNSITFLATNTSLEADTNSPILASWPRRRT